jgi:hypothetical protein
MIERDDRLWIARANLTAMRETISTVLRKPTVFRGRQQTTHLPEASIASRRIIAAQPADRRADQATGDSIRVIVSTDVTARSHPGRLDTMSIESHEPRRPRYFSGATSLEWRGDVRRQARTLVLRSPEALGGSPSRSPEGSAWWRAEPHSGALMRPSGLPSTAGNRRAPMPVRCLIALGSPV